MTIEELKTRNKKLSADIEALLVQYEKDTGAIPDFKITRTALEGFGLDGAYVIEPTYRVKVQVTL